MAKVFTIFWGLVAISFASIASLFENLIQFVNIIGSLFYGSILGIFLVAFYMRNINAKAVFMAALLTEALVIFVYFQSWVAFLWLNLIGCIGVIFLSFVLNIFFKNKNTIDDLETFNGEIKL